MQQLEHGSAVKIRVRNQNYFPIMASDVAGAHLTLLFSPGNHDTVYLGRSPQTPVFLYGLEFFPKLGLGPISEGFESIHKVPHSFFTPQDPFDLDFYHDLLWHIGEILPILQR